MENDWKNQSSGGSCDDPYASDARVKDEYRKENQVLKNERSMRGDDLGARLRMDAEVGSQQMPLAGQLGSRSCDTTSKPDPVETLEQEKIRLSRELSIRIANNEAALYALRNVINELEVKQKSMYYLRENINQSSRVQHDQVMELRRILNK